MSKRRKAKAKKSARNLPVYMQNIAFSKRTGRADRKHKSRKLGTFGAASDVRRVDPSEYNPTE
ncbi:hypothetical protein [Actibacterium sp. MT2.3-13A]|uniref:hypothetical protein n=1 Tax=Actibacterium sp. MT2.3-13A TaxID=2828332 RepID=UPI001BAB4D08|nr:hypothetical protein [Actibacterium sp. MT2.3-13A]